MFEVFPDNPDEVDASGVSNLRASYMQVLRHGVPHFMDVQKYDIREPDDSGASSVFAEHYWQPANFPVLDDRGRVRYIIHRVVDVTELVRLQHSGREVQERLERDLYLRAREIEHSNELLRESLLQKETLLREIHHRVKNNLQVIAGLLRLQARHVTDQAAHDALSEMGGRVRAIAEIHQALYSSSDLARVDMSGFATQLAKNLLSVYGIDRERVRLQLEIASSSLDIGLAVPCGLILNELISNALKHAFPDGRSGIVVATLGEDAQLLSVSDDGVGLSHAIGNGPGTTLGMQLVELLAEQIGAQVRVESERGTRVTVTRATA
jgi:two-component sensor histidine kinase